MAAKFHDLERGMRLFDDRRKTVDFGQHDVEDRIWDRFKRAANLAQIFEMRIDFKEAVPAAEFAFGLWERGIFQLPYPVTAFICGNEIYLARCQGARLLEIFCASTFARSNMMEVLPSVAICGPQVREGKKVFEIRPFYRFQGADELQRYAQIAFDVVVTSVGILSSRGCTKEHCPAPAKVNAKRQKKGSPMIREKIVVSLGPRAIFDRSSGQTHASPVTHWRRGHFRTLGEGTEWQREVPVAPCLVNGAEDCPIPPPKEYIVPAFNRGTA